MATAQTSLYMQFNRQFADALDSTELHPNLIAANAYAYGVVNSQTTAYPGQMIKWKNADGVFEYGVIQEDGTIKPGGGITLPEIETLLNDLERVKTVQYYNDNDSVTDTTYTVGDLVFIFQDDSELVVNLFQASMFEDIYFDNESNELVIMPAGGGAEIRIPLGDLIPVYVGSTGDNIQISIGTGNTIEATLLTGTVTFSQLHIEVQSEINTISENLNDLHTFLFGTPEEGELVDGEIFRLREKDEDLQRQIDELDVGEITVTVSTENSNTVEFAGNGTSSSPLIANRKYEDEIHYTVGFDHSISRIIIDPLKYAGANIEYLIKRGNAKQAGQLRIMLQSQDYGHINVIGWAGVSFKYDFSINMLMTTVDDTIDSYGADIHLKIRYFEIV